MEWLRVTAHLYRQVFLRAGSLLLKNWPVMATVVVYDAVLAAGTALAWRLGFLGGFLLTLLWAACASSFLALVEGIVRTSRIMLGDFRRSFRAYLWDVVAVTFFFWLLFRVLEIALASAPQARLVLLCVQLALFVFFNPLPELIYLGGAPIVDLLRQSYEFISENWIEWFPPTVAAGLVLAAIALLVWPGAGGLVRDFLTGGVLYYAMVLRGLLFQELRSSTRRSRAFRYRAA